MFIISGLDLTKWMSNKGYRAEVRRERKKRDIPQPCECALTNRYYIKQHYANLYFFASKSQSYLRYPSA
jgi:hypothetical protein